MKISSMVKQYADTAGQSPSVTLMLALITEEYEEFMEAWPEKQETLKELADLVYVIFGYANAAGIDLDRAIERVHDNNMKRMIQPDGTIKRRDDGKIIKNPSVEKVYLEDLV